MLLSQLGALSENPRMAIISIMLMVPSLLIALTVHEYAHGRMALALGDKTALMYGRLSLNPLHHLDPIGALMLLLFGFGFAKPVPVNMRNVSKVSYKTGTVLISLAGPVSNLLLAFIGVFGLLLTNTITQNIYQIPISVIIYYGLPLGSNLAIIIFTFFQYFALLNIGLAVFNLIPIPPLDGSRILTVFLPGKAQMWFHRHENIIQLVLFALLWMNVLNGVLVVARSFIFNGMVNLISLLPFIK